MRWICGGFGSQRHADCIQGCNLTAVTRDISHVTPFCYDRSCDVPLSTIVVRSITFVEMGDILAAKR